MSNYYCPKCGLQVSKDTLVCPDFLCRCIIPIYRGVFNNGDKEKKEEKAGKETES